MKIEELKRFCATDEANFWAHRPWTRDGYTWATNGHILVRVPALAGVPDAAGAPLAAKLLAKQPDAKEWFAVPECAMPARIQCSWCDGTGKDPSDRRYKCERCGGSKTIENIRAGLTINGVNFARRYLALIQGWEIAPNGNYPARIRYEEVAGLLMPLRLGD